jgi:menaquinone-dependent protoporphyrinogen oxidase
MKPIILYESKHGATKTCATYLETNIPGSTLSTVHDWQGVFQQDQPIILGSCIYMGQFNKHVKAFLTDHEDTLLNHPLYLFYCGMNESEMESLIENNVSTAIKDHATIVYAGGAFHFKEMKWWERFIVKKIAHVSESTSNLKYDQLDMLIKKVNV